MARFLSQPWLDELDAALAGAGPLDSPERLELGQLVTGAPGGDVGYTLVLGGGAPGGVRRGVEGAAVTLVESYEDAVAIATGAPASELLAAGRVKLRGDARALLAASDLLAAVSGALSVLSGTTQY